MFLITLSSVLHFAHSDHGRHFHFILDRIKIQYNRTKYDTDDLRYSNIKSEQAKRSRSSYPVLFQYQLPVGAGDDRNGVKDDGLCESSVWHHLLHHHLDAHLLRWAVTWHRCSSQYVITYNLKWIAGRVQRRYEEPEAYVFFIFFPAVIIGDQGKRSVRKARLSGKHHLRN